MDKELTNPILLMCFGLLAFLYGGYHLLYGSKDNINWIIIIGGLVQCMASGLFLNDWITYKIKELEQELKELKKIKQEVK